jgi:hypothetical protein
MRRSAQAGGVRAGRVRVTFVPAALLATGVAAAAPLAAQVPRIGFEAFASPVTTEYQATVGRPVTAGGFDFLAYRPPGARNALGTWGTDAAQDPDGALNVPGNRGTATALYATQAGSIIDMVAAGQIFELGVAFNLYAIDVAHLYAQSYLPFGTVLQPFTLTFFGFHDPAAGASVSQTFTVGVPAGGTPLLSTLLFNPGWRGLYAVAWQQSTLGLGQQHQFTNVAAEVVPEPGSAALLGAGLVAVGAVARRRARGHAGRAPAG